MGIPVPAKVARSQDKPAPKYRSVPRGYMRRPELDDFDNNEVPSNSGNNGPIPIVTKEELKQRGSEVSRMGNYFNIVIAPPPIKAMQPRKVIQNEAYRNAAKRMN